MKRIHVVDSHTEGEPTRVVLEGGPELGGGSMAARLHKFREEYDHYRSAIVNEPRGSDVMVGAILLQPMDPIAAGGVIFFNNVGFLGMCGHGTIGLVATLAYLGRIGPGEHRFETPVGTISTRLHANGAVSLTNVPSYRAAHKVQITVPGIGVVTGDVAWGGNWFFLIEQHEEPLELAEIDRLTDYAWRVRQAVNEQGFPEVDHIELFGKPRSAKANSRSFVLCPGKAYDRSPCGTGTSAKLACMAADGKLGEGETWVQESIIGSSFSGSYHRQGNEIIPIITGSAWVNGEATLLLAEGDPFCWGIRR